ncbi:MAG: hypothetical protein NUV73_03915 [Candidatus Daviesbacteria bacterium]|nr:hypothetical protein [Candidatus Daviesbacteria bacterium]
MNKKILLILFLVILVIIVIFFGIRRSSTSLVSPAARQVSAEINNSPMPSTSSNQPKEIRYDSSTDLQKELDSVNPQVIDSDFEE